MQQEVRIEKLVHGGQGLGVLSDGRKVFVWNALPGERVLVRLTKKKKDYAQAIAEEILEPSVDRQEPLDEAYLSTSPWQIMSFTSENQHKKAILQEAFDRESVSLPNFEFITDGPQLHYRNKMEYSFWADDDGLHLALFHRASHGKRIVTGSAIARPEIDATANKILSILNKHGIRGSQLKTVVVRVNTKGACLAALYVKDKAFPALDELQSTYQGVSVYFSDPRSPASIQTKLLRKWGDPQLSDIVLGTPVTYNVSSFFQVNLPVFERAAERIKSSLAAAKHVVDMYAGVGTIGLAVGAQTLVESDVQNISMAKLNAPKGVEVIHASTETALEYITGETTIIFDPPRAGLHGKVVDRILEVLPPKIIYLSCNPATQARDIARLEDSYDITDFTGYNFFPRTPHIESLAVLVRK